MQCTLYKALLNLVMPVLNWNVIWYHVPLLFYCIFFFFLDHYHHHTILTSFICLEFPCVVAICPEFTYYWYTLATIAQEKTRPITTWQIANFEDQQSFHSPCSILFVCNGCHSYIISLLITLSSIELPLISGGTSVYILRKISCKNYISIYKLDG